MKTAREGAPLALTIRSPIAMVLSEMGVAYMQLSQFNDISVQLVVSRQVLRST